MDSALLSLHVENTLLCVLPNEMIAIVLGIAQASCLTMCKPMIKKLRALARIACISHAFYIHLPDFLAKYIRSTPGVVGYRAIPQFRAEIFRKNSNKTFTMFDDAIAICTSEWSSRGLEATLRCFVGMRYCSYKVDPFTSTVSTISYGRSVKCTEQIYSIDCPDELPQNGFVDFVSQFLDALFPCSDDTAAFQPSFIPVLDQ